MNKSSALTAPRCLRPVDGCRTSYEEVTRMLFTPPLRDTERVGGIFFLYSYDCFFSWLDKLFMFFSELLQFEVHLDYDRTIQ